METSITSQRLVKMHNIYPLIMFAMLLRCSNGQQDTKRYHLSPQQYGLKPANPLEEVPIPDLKETPPSLDDPRVGELNITSLLMKLGSNYDANMMSIEPPEEKDNDISYFGYRRSHLGRLIPTGTMPEYLNKMDFKYLTLTNGSKLRTRISPKLKRKIQQFLWAYTACPVVYRWKDLGIRFWPRYLKVGYCPKNVSCSIPPGMTCKASAVTHKMLLRWHCKSSYYPNKYSSSSNHRRHCGWMKVQYPVLTECSCSCETTSND
ncbi:noggin-2-like [Planococcus citri]|uniref:noggin-2-like n=1 Tax=Planococcus citri TaxID=170843 RepID=UPI0031F8F28F